MGMKPTVLSNGEEAHKVLQDRDSWGAAGGELGTRQAADRSSKVSCGEAADELAAPALTGLLHSVLSEHGRIAEDEVIDEPTARAEECGVFAQRTAAEEGRHREPRPTVDVPAGGGGNAYPPRQRSYRVVAAGWLRRRSEPEVSG